MGICDLEIWSKLSSEIVWNSAKLKELIVEQQLARDELKTTVPRIQAAEWNIMTL